MTALDVRPAPIPPEDRRNLADLMTAARDGDMTAWARVWDVTSPVVLAYLGTRLTEALAAARTAEVYTRALTEIRTANLAEPLRWLLRLADAVAPPAAPGRHRAVTSWRRRFHLPWLRLRAHIGGY